MAQQTSVFRKLALENQVILQGIVAQRFYCREDCDGKIGVEAYFGEFDKIDMGSLESLFNGGMSSR